MTRSPILIILKRIVAYHNPIVKCVYIYSMHVYRQAYLYLYFLWITGNKRTNSQSKNQILQRMNLALAKNCNASINEKIGASAGNNWRHGKPVRVVRNYKLGKFSKYAPEEGNRYIEYIIFTSIDL